MYFDDIILLLHFNTEPKYCTPCQYVIIMPANLNIKKATRNLQLRYCSNLVELMTLPLILPLEIFDFAGAPLSPSQTVPYIYARLFACLRGGESVERGVEPPLNTLSR